MNYINVHNRFQLQNWRLFWWWIDDNDIANNDNCNDIDHDCKDDYIDINGNNGDIYNDYNDDDNFNSNNDSDNDDDHVDDNDNNEI